MTAPAPSTAATPAVLAVAMTPAVLAAVVAAAVVVVAARLAAGRLVLARTVAGPAVEVGRGHRRGRRPREADDATVAEWCEHAARGLHGGASLSRAMTAASVAVPAAAAPFTPVLRALARGRGLPAALDALDADPSRPAGLVAPVLRAGAELGGPSARALDRAALVLHGRAAEHAERHTAAAQARLSARVMTLLPVGTLGLLVAAEGSTRAALVTPVGLTCLTAGLAGNAAGWWWMRRVVGRVA